MLYPEENNNQTAAMLNATHTVHKQLLRCPAIVCALKSHLQSCLEIFHSKDETML